LLAHASNDAAVADPFARGWFATTNRGRSIIELGH